ncbi:MAG: hypothetical protein Q9166_002062 [cf. Caloplaca sp. 2 TL-2023]
MFGGLDKPTLEVDANQSLKRKRNLDRELLYLRDPLKLAENTIALLRNNDNEKALELVRMASKKIQCTVSWNHLVDYEMSKGRIQKAVKIYNEMKKRAQKPDAQTYTIILRGLSWHPHLQESVPLALKIYYSMFADNCPVKPNIIHTNAVLKVCALARDVDALFGVAAKLPNKGPGAPNNLTFTTILNAIRITAWHNDNDLRDETWEEKSLRRQRAVTQGRKLWEEIIPRWRAGDMWIDEELVCAMGRLLLLGSTEQDYDDVLSLAEQVMSIPRQKRQLREQQAIADSEEQTAIAESPATRNGSQDDPTKFELEDDDSAFSSSAPAPVASTALVNVFRPQSTAPKISIALPGRNTLSLLLDACINLRAVSSAQAYWGLLTDPSGPYKVNPDSENYHMYLRLLRVQRASKTASELITDMHSGELKAMHMLQPKTFRIAFSACVRDKNSPYAMEPAIKILKTMYKALPEPDVKALDMFAEIAVARVRQDFRTTLDGLRALETGILLLRNYINFGFDDVPYDTRIAAVGFAQRTIGMFDSILYYAGDRLENDDKSYIMHEKMKLSAWVEKRAKMPIERERRERGREQQRELVARQREAKAKGEVYIPREKRRGSERRVIGERKVIPEGVFARKNSKWLAEKAEKGLMVGKRKRMERAKVSRERSGEFEDF